MAISQRSREGMAQGATAVEEAYETIVGLQTQLHGHQTELMGSWKGESAVAFANAYAEFDDGFKRIVQSLNGILGSLRHAGVTYDASEAEQTATVNRVTSLLNGSGR
jgi:WXG100 family type VII secretion target